jgi:hypothetical protein
MTNFLALGVVLPQPWYYALGKLIYAIVKVLNPPKEEI